MIKKLLIGVSAIFCFATSFAQTTSFQIHLEPLVIPELGGLQSFAFGQHLGKWLIIGGRLDGLHRRQPFAAFDVAGNNNQLMVIDPITKQKWTAPLTSLSVKLQEQLSSTNMEFHQDGSKLYFAGGYGFSSATNSKITFPYLTAIDVPNVISAIIAGSSFVNYFNQINDSLFAVTGGHLKKINNTFYLIGGNKFDGNYNPNGGPSFTQVYTNAIRKFNIIHNGASFSVQHLLPMVDAANLHRRDYNAVPQILTNGTEGITVFSGVFQPTVNLPFLNCVNIDSSSYQVNNAFQQYYNHYHCAVLPLFSSLNNEMSNVFFGGIAQYFDSSGVLVQDNNVPFVKTIAKVTRNANGNMAEYKLPIEMPGLLGAGSEFIPNLNVPHFNNEVFKLDSFTADSTLVGYIYGGISSTAPNVFFTNTGTQSAASSQIFKVYVLKKVNTGMHVLNAQSIGTLKLQVFPNPNNGVFTVNFNLSKKSVVKITVHNTSGTLVNSQIYTSLAEGNQSIAPSIEQKFANDIYYVTVETDQEKATQKIIINP